MYIVSCMTMEQYLSDLENPGVAWLSPGSPVIAGLKKSAGVKGISVFVLDGAKMGDKDGIMAHFADMLKFPAYFGKNWDALQECLADLESWLPAKGYLIVVENADLIYEGSDENFAVLLEILNEVSLQFADEDKIIFKVLMLASDPALRDLIGETVTE